MNQYSKKKNAEHHMSVKELIPLQVSWNPMIPLPGLVDHRPYSLSLWLEGMPSLRLPQRLEHK